jgi:RNA-dependent RNA polymerase
VNGLSFLNERVGHALKNGFELAGRQFEFLMYSNSALRGHQVWFMSPFKTMASEKRRDKDGYYVLDEDGSPVTDSVFRTVNAEWIRSQLGKFEGQLMRQPSKYAARMAQAFTATDGTGVFLERHQWEVVDDILTEDEKYNYTDGYACFISIPASPSLILIIYTDSCGTISQELADLIWAAMCRNRIDHGANTVPPSVVMFNLSA